MAGSYNRVILVGNLTRDPEIRYTQSGKAVTKFSLAVNNPRNKEETTFVDIVAWDRLGETCNTYLKKGQNTLVEGRLVIRSYDDKDGNKRKATEVVIDNMQMLGSRRDGGSGGTGEEEFAPVGARAAAAPNGTGDAFSGDDLDDEIPF
ncbi:MAG TPA: single-stranded DNA-binding protein [Candidatus Dormibacteraeota bacterium]|jgi:single-strand DNA-binding protein|nr:single-stranded DNA-binding protein [Candidatus Dormibacteraeota bacterium]